MQQKTPDPFDTRYDHAGRVKEVHGAPVPTFTDAVPGAASVLTAVSPVTYTTYDEGGNILTVIDPEGRVTTNTFDELGRMVTTEDDAGFVTTFGYDLAGNRTSVTDALGNTTTFTFDGLNRLLKEQPPGTAVATQHVYNALVEERTVKADGWTLVYAYDARNRLETTTASHANVAEADRPVTTRDYDWVGNLKSVTESGARSFLSVSYEYDNHNRIIEERHGTNAESPLTSSYTYDLAGNRDTVIYPGGSGVFTAYDALNRATSVAQMTLTAGNTWQPQRTSTWEYDLAGKVLHHNQGLNSRVSSQWDAQGRLFSRVIQGKFLGNVQVEGRSVPEYAVLGIQRYLYDKTGNLRWMSERYNGQSAARTVTLAYDASLRLDTETIAEADGGTQLSDYNYDALGNRTTYTKTVNGGTPTVSTYTHNAWNQLEQFTRTGSDPATVSYEYDDGGNRKKRTKGTQVDNYTWDHLGRLKSVAHAGTGKTYAYGYDYRSRRVSRLEGGDLTLCGYSGGTSVVELKRAANNSTNTLPGSVGEPYKLSKTFIRGSDMGGGVGGLIYSLKQTASGPSQPQVTLSTGTAGAVTGTWSNLSNSHFVAPRYNHYNGRGDVAAQVDDAGGLAWTGSYEAYGTRTKETGTNDDRQRANTKEEDPTGLLNEGMRYRDLETGTWLSRDPAGFVDGPNLYAYVKQNPWSKFDPHGLWMHPAVLANNRIKSATGVDVMGTANATGKWMSEHPRTMGAVQTAGGAAQVVAGAAGLATPEPTGITKVAGVIAVSHGVDDVQAGVRQMISGQQTENLTTQGTRALAKAAGASDEAANNIAIGTNLATGFVAPATSAKAVAAAADEMASGALGVKGVVMDGQIVGKPKLISDSSSHAEIASKAGVLKKANESGTPGELVDGAEAFTAQANGKGGWNVMGSGNFNKTVSPSAEEAVKEGLGTSPTISGTSAASTAANASAGTSAATSTATAADESVASDEPSKDPAK